MSLSYPDCAPGIADVDEGLAIVRTRWDLGASLMHSSGSSQLFAVSHGSQDAVLKMLVSSCSETGEVEGREHLDERYDRELEVSRAFSSSRHGLPVLTCGVWEEAPFMVMPRVPGITLQEALAQRRFDTAESILVLLQIAEALGELHAMGYLHRDLKPANLLLGESQLFLIDFGASRRSGRPADCAARFVDYSAGYSAPECFCGEEPDGLAADVYSLAMTAHDLFTGKNPYDEWLAQHASDAGDGFECYLRYLAEGAPARLADDPGLPRQLGRLLDAALSRNPADRPALGKILEALTAAWSQAEARPSPTLVSVSQPLTSHGAVITHLGRDASYRALRACDPA